MDFLTLILWVLAFVVILSGVEQEFQDYLRRLKKHQEQADSERKRRE